MYPGEKLLWAGQPKRGIVFELSDIYNTIFSLAMLVFIGFVIKLLLKISVFLALSVGGFFFLAIATIGIGRFFIEAELRKHTFYGLTDKRIILVSRMHPKIISSIDLIPGLKVGFLPRMDGTSTIDLNPDEQVRHKGRWYLNRNGSTSLFRLEQGNLVHQQIQTILKNGSHNMN
ncbi:hypothetical protein EGI32_04930 [Ferruginibacter sp. HRS2-29]|nr:hypothetical protein [Ferruginibacter sp. HRS2-29]